MRFSTHVRLVTGSVLGVLVLGAAAQAEFTPQQKELAARLAAFRDQPAVQMNRLPVKKNSKGEIVTASPFTAADIASRRFVDIKNTPVGLTPETKDFFGKPFSVILPTDGIASMIGTPTMRRLEDIEFKNLRSSTLPESPWSGDYWSLDGGATAHRYADPYYPGWGWKSNYDYLTSHLGQFTQATVNQLSPAEKFDLLVGDSNWTLTWNAINSGKMYYDMYGSVESWMGLCHGWAPAAYRSLRPRNKVTLVAADGVTRITFYPHDIKALQTMMWANGSFEQGFGGGRCNSKNPQANAVGRVIEPDCFDQNPGAWHLIVTTLLGERKDAFVIDATYDYQVWNQPVYAYSYSYFNPQTFHPVNTLAQARVLRSQFTNDKFREFRSSQAVYVVGVSMQLTYISESGMSSVPTDDPSYDYRTNVDYEYDLELDASGNIIGGEWYNNNHPDFVWTAYKGTKVWSPGDSWLDSSYPGVTLARGVPTASVFRQAAPSSSQQGIPLRRVVEGLERLAQTPENP